nr:uncharacterized mitochondrial protein AtMg00810-like [Tanacetum cinerariifolium]
MMRLVVEIEYVDMNADEFDKETGSSDGLQPEQVDLNCVHALNEPHLHEIHVVLKVLMIELVMHTEKNDMVFHTMKTGMLRLVIEIDVVGMTADVVDKVTCSFDGWKLNVKTPSTPIETKKPLVKDAEAVDVDVHLYRSMIGSLMYLTSSWPDIMYVICACSRFQVTSKTLHLQAVNRIFRYLKGQPKLGLWYPRESAFDMEAYSNSDYAGANLDRKSTTRGCQFLGRRLISWRWKKQTVVATSTTKAEYVVTASYRGQVLWIQNQMLDYGFNFMITKIYIDNESIICIMGCDCYGDYLGFILFFGMKIEGHKWSRGDQVQLPYDSPLSVGHTSDRAEGSLNLDELSAPCTNLSNRVLALEIVKDAQAKEILTLKARIKKLEKSKDDSAELNAELDEDMEYMDIEEAMNEGRQSTVDTARPDVSTTRPDDDTARQELSTADSKDTNRPARSILTLKPLLTIDPKDKGKCVLEEPESAKKMTKSDFDAAQIARDEEIARQLEVELQAKVEKERQREEQASMNYITNLYDEVQASIDADHELAVRLTHEEQEKYTVVERAKLLSEYFEIRKKQLAEERVVAIKNKPPTKTQLRMLMMTYLKNMDFVPIDSDEDERRIRDMTKIAEEESNDIGVDSTKKRKAGSRMKKMSKRKKTDVDLEEEEKLKTFLKIDLDQEGIIDYEFLDKRFPIINWESKFYHYDRHGAEGIYYRIFKSDGSSRWIKTFSEMVIRFDRLDLVELYNLVMQRFKTTTPEGVDLIL